MICYSNYGFSFRAVDNNYITQDGEVLFSDYANEEQLCTVFPQYLVIKQDNENAKNNVTILSQITALEQKQLRPLREYALGDTTALPLIQAIDNEIAALRVQLK